MTIPDQGFDLDSRKVGILYRVHMGLLMGDLDGRLQGRSVHFLEYLRKIGGVRIMTGQGFNPDSPNMRHMGSHGTL